jgi:hypothetical protein
MNTAANHITAGRDSRLAVFWNMDYAYADSGLTDILSDGNLDASDRVPTGSTYALREIERTNRNVPAPKLASREFAGAIAVCALAFCGAAQATCIDQLRADLDVFKEEAKRVVWMPGMAKIDNLRVMIGTHDNGNNGEYEPGNDLVRVNARVCDLPKPRRDFVLAHEVGHAVVLALYPEMLEEVHTKLYRHGTAVHEDMANQYAARIYPRAEIPALLALWDQSCADGYAIQCEHAKSWRAGMSQ